MRITAIRTRTSRGSRLVRVTRDALIVASAAAIVLAGAACSGKSKTAATPTATPTAAPQAAGAAKQAAQALKTDLKPLNAPVPLPLPKLDGLAVSMNPVLPTLKEFKVNSDIRDVPITIGAIATPPFRVNMNLGAPSIESLMSSFAVPTVPQMPSIPTMPPGGTPGATPPAGIPTPPAGFATPPTGMPSLPPGFTLPPGITIPGMP